MIHNKTHEEWIAAGEVVLLVGDVGYEIDTCYRKIGDGVTPYSDLPYALYLSPRTAARRVWHTVDPVIGYSELVYEAGTGRSKVGDGNKSYSQLPYTDEYIEKLNGHFFTVKSAKGLTLTIDHSGLPDNAYLVLKRRRKTPGGGVFNRQPKVWKWSFVGKGDALKPTDPLYRLQCLAIPVGRDADVYNIDLTPFLPFVHRETEGAAEFIHISGNASIKNGINNSDVDGTYIYQDLALQIVYKQIDTTKNYKECFLFGRIFPMRYVATTSHGNLHERIVIK